MLYVIGYVLSIIVAIQMGYGMHFFWINIGGGILYVTITLLKGWFMNRNNLDKALVLVYVAVALTTILLGYGKYFFIVNICAFMLLIAIALIKAQCKKEAVWFPDYYHEDCFDCEKGNESCPACPLRKWGKPYKGEKNHDKR
jgi:hypothetical protein